MTLVSSQSIPRLAAHAPIEPDSQIEKIIMTNSKLWRKSYLAQVYSS